MIYADRRIGLAHTARTLLIAVVLVLAGCTGKVASPKPTVSPEPTTMANPSSPRASVAPSTPPGVHTSADIAFVSLLLQHQQQTLALTELASRRSTSAVIRQLAAASTRGRGEQSQVMVSWLRGWDRPVPGRAQWGDGDPHDKPGMIPESQLANLAEVSVTLFDRQWMSALITHHRGVIDLTREEQTAGRNASVKALAATVRATYTRELAALQHALAKLTES